MQRIRGLAPLDALRGCGSTAEMIEKYRDVTFLSRDRSRSRLNQEAHDDQPLVFGVYGEGLEPAYCPELRAVSEPGSFSSGPYYSHVHGAYEQFRVADPGICFFLPWDVDAGERHTPSVHNGLLKVERLVRVRCGPRFMATGTTLDSRCTTTTEQDDHGRLLASERPLATASTTVPCLLLRFLPVCSAYRLHQGDGRKTNALLRSNAWNMLRDGLKPDGHMFAFTIGTDGHFPPAREYLQIVRERGIFEGVDEGATVPARPHREPRVPVLIYAIWAWPPGSAEEQQTEEQAQALVRERLGLVGEDVGQTGDAIDSGLDVHIQLIRDHQPRATTEYVEGFRWLTARGAEFRRARAGVEARGASAAARAWR